MSLYVTTPDSFLYGHAVRRARKTYTCDGWTSRLCRTQINPGDLYVEGDPAPDRAGGFGTYRYCAKCCSCEIEEAGE